MNRCTAIAPKSVLLVIVAGCFLRAATARAAPGSMTDCNVQSGRGDAAPVAAAAAAFRETLSPALRAQLDQPLSRAPAIRWSNLPVGIVPRIGVRVGDLDAP